MGGRPTNCPAVQATTDWRDINTNTIGNTVDPVGYETIRGVKNNFINNFGSAAFPGTYVEELNSNGATGGAAARATLDVTGFPGILALTARAIAVNYTAEEVAAGAMVDDGLGSGGMRAATTSDTRPGHQRYYVGIRPLGSFSLGAPIFDRAVTNAVWNGSIHWIGNGTAANSNTTARDFKMLVNYDTRVIQGAVPITVGDTTGNHLVINGGYTQAGIITGDAYINRFASDPNAATVPVIGVAPADNLGQVSGILGYRGAVGVFVGPEINGTTVTDSFSGGFVVRPQ